MKDVFIIDDHTAIREGFKAILERSERYRVSGEAAAAEPALDSMASAETPALAIVDISLPGMSGLELCSELRKRFPDIRVAILSMHRRFDYIAGAFRAGASAYVSKDAGAECIVEALDSAVAGRYYLDPSSLRLFVDEAAASGRGKEPKGREGIPGLSDREREVLKLLAEGRRAEEIAVFLGLSQKTVENHLSNITSKLGVRDRFDLYRLAARLEDS
jgi:DNA-binding NarL/FixJ family response regulator